MIIIPSNQKTDETVKIKKFKKKPILDDLYYL